MAVPARPTSGAPVGTDWGQVAHDSIVAMDIQAGSVDVTFASGNAASSVGVITFARPFAAVPVVVAVMGGVAAAGVNYMVGVANPTTTGAQVQSREVRENTTTVGTRPVQWMAYGPRA